jgi:hypothetical protein
MGFAALKTIVNTQVFQHLGEDATLNGAPVRGIFLTPGEPSSFSGYPTGLQQAAFVLDSSIGVVLDDILVYCGATYRVVNIEPDGAGFNKLTLRLSA